MRVFITGGTGAIGRHTLSALIRDGHEVTALVRSAKKAAIVVAEGAKPSSVSFFDRAELTRAMRGHDAVINLATSIPPSSKFMQKKAWHLNDRIRNEGSMTLVNAAIDAGVPRFIQESVSMLYQDGGDGWIDETSPLDEFPMAVGNYAAEASANRFSAAGHEGVILRFGWFYGPGATHSEEFLALARRWGICVMMGDANGYLSSIQMVDGGTAAVAALKAAPGTYNVVDDEPLTKSAYADALGVAARRKPWLKSPGRLAYLLGHRTTSLTRSLRATNKKFRQATGWAPRYKSAREGWLAMAAALPERL